MTLTMHRPPISSSSPLRTNKYVSQPYYEYLSSAWPGVTLASYFNTAGRPIREAKMIKIKKVRQKAEPANDDVLEN